MSSADSVWSFRQEANHIIRRVFVNESDMCHHENAIVGLALSETDFGIRHSRSIRRFHDNLM
jgi:hypothetical protein